MGAAGADLAGARGTGIGGGTGTGTLEAALSQAATRAALTARLLAAAADVSARNLAAGRRRVHRHRRRGDQPKLGLVAGSAGGIALPEGDPGAIFDAARQLESIAGAFEG